MSRQVNLFDIDIHALTMPECLQEMHSWIMDENGPCRYVVTPNVDHTLIYRESAEMRDAYHNASLVVADGVPLVWASKLLRRRLPERINGTDLTVNLLALSTPERPLKAYLLGAMPGVAERAAQEIETRWPQTKITGCYSPPFGFEKDAAETQKILDQIATAAPDILVVGLGAPKQELWVAKYRHELQAKVALCVGATIDFLAGEKPRAPRWMQRIGLEWFHRLLSEPRRLFKRYARDAWMFPQMLWGEFRRKPQSVTVK